MPRLRTCGTGALAVFALLLGGCASTLSARSRVPHLLAAPSETGDASYELTIWTVDPKQPEGLARVHTQAGVGLAGPQGALLPGYLQRRQFQQAALVRRVGADGLRFDVILTDEWRELATVRGYEVVLRDDRGREVRPADAWMTAETHRDYEAAYQAWKSFQTVRIHDGGPSRTYAIYAPEEYYVQERVYRGRATLLFHERGLLRPETRSLTLELRSSARTLRFTWDFEKSTVLARRQGAGN